MYITLFEDWVFESLGVEIAELRKTAKDLREQRKLVRERWKENKNPGVNGRLTSIELELAKTNGEIRKLIIQRRREWEQRGS